MPLYEYRCEACGAQEEVLESFSAPSEHACTACGAVDGMHRQLSRAGFVLSGGGWYASGYGAETKGGPEPAPKPGAKAETASGGGTSPAPAAPSTPSDSSGGCAGGCACH